MPSVYWLTSPTDIEYREEALMAGVGLALGLVCAAGAARFLESQLFAVTPGDARSYIGAAAAIGAAALTACWLPARRASAISPLEAIRAE